MEVGVVLKDSRAEMTIHGEILAREFIDKYCRQFDGKTLAAPVGQVSGIPRIGTYWAGQGGIYAGTVRGEEADYHLVLHKDEKESIQWQPALDWAKTLEADGHKDFNLPNRREQAILYGNLKDKCKPEWHWSCEQHASRSDYAWVQAFSDGGQDLSRKDGYVRARAGRRVI